MDSHESKNNRDYEEYEDYDDYDDYIEGKDDDHQISCMNMDPLLAKLMGIIIEEQSINSHDTWTPPQHSGLSNSESIINNESQTITVEFTQIKNKIRNSDKLTKDELEKIKHFSNDEKQQIIELYNNILMENIYKKNTQMHIV